MNDRGGEENCKAAANKLRKIPRAPAERIPLNPPRAHVKRRSNASFETKHRLPVAFPGSLSFTQGRLPNLILREKSRELFFFFLPFFRLGRCRPLSVLSEKSILVGCGLDGERNLGSLGAALAQPSGSMFTLFLGDSAYAQCCKGHCYSRCHFRFDR
jgi:hypothetical protein